MRAKTHRATATAWLFLGVFGLTVLLYSPVLGHEFLDLDDDVYVTQNPAVLQGLTWDGIRWAFSQTHAANWHPLTWLSHMLDVELYGLNPAGHHATSVILHGLNAGMLFLALRLLTPDTWPCLFAAVLFAVHPLRVESVAWAAERKDVLSGFFWMSTIVAYAWYARRPGRGRYLVVFLFMALGLLAKPILVTLPGVLLLLDLWPLKRWQLEERRPCGRPLRSLVMEKLPLLGLAAASSAATIYAQRAGGAVGRLEVVPISTCLANALVSYVTYLSDFFWPAHLAVFYPHLGTLSRGAFSSLLVQAVGAALLLGAVSTLVCREVRQRPYLVVGWFWYLATLLPVIGVLQVGAQARADRYTYVPLIGITVMFLWAAWDWVERRPGARAAAVAVLSLLAAAATVATHAELGHWRNSFTLYEHALRGTRGNYFVLNNLGVLYLKRGDLARAQDLFEQALPDPDAHNNLGTLFMKRGDLDQAAAQFEEALRIRPRHPKALFNLGILADRQGDLVLARQRLEEALLADPGSVEVRNYLGVVYAKQGNLALAEAELQDALRLRPDSYDTHYNLGKLLVLKGDFSGAELRFGEALRIRPDSRDAQASLQRLRDRRAR